MFGKTLKTIPKVIHTGRKRLRAERTRFNTLEVINIIYKEFDPGSGRTLAARLTHASRTECFHGSFRMEVVTLSGGRVSNT